MSRKRKRYFKGWGLPYVQRICGEDGDLYLWRLNLFATPWFGLKLHWIRREDHDPDLHDHPWWFASFILWGWYVEELPKFVDGEWHNYDTRMRLRCLLSWKRATDCHRIVEVPHYGAVTLVVTGPYERMWGFHTMTGWLNYKDYLGVNEDGR